MRNANSREGKSINNWRGLKDFFLNKGGGRGKNVHQQHEPLTPLECQWTKSSTLPAVKSLGVADFFAFSKKNERVMYILTAGGIWITAQQTRPRS